jgi:hypothetical protein
MLWWLTLELGATERHRMPQKCHSTCDGVQMRQVAQSMKKRCSCIILYFHKMRSVDSNCI